MVVSCKLERLIFAAFALLCTIHVSYGYTEEDGVLVLGDEDYEKAIQEHEIIAIEFYAPWCGHCKKLVPEYAKAAGILKESKIPIAKIDATIHKKSAEKFEIKGFPTIKIFKNGAASDYNGGRTAEDIVEYMKKKAGPAAVPLKTVKEATDFVAANPKGAVIGFVSKIPSDAEKKFLEIADREDFRATFAITDVAAVKSHYGLKKDGLVLITEEGKFSLPVDFANFKIEDIGLWLTGHSVPVLKKYDQGSAREIFGGAIQTHLIAFLDEDAKDFAKVSDAIKAAGGKFRTKMLTLYMPKTEANILKVFDINVEELPKLVIADLSTGQLKKFSYSGDFTDKGITKFATDYVDGKLKPFLKSEDPKPEHDQGPVKILTGKSFQEKVIDAKKDVFVKFYAPWCGHCVALEPKWIELGKLYEKTDSVVIAKMDSTANEIDVPGVNIRGFPTLLFFPHGDKSNPIPYEGQREVSPMANFVKDTAKIPLNLTEDLKDQFEEIEEEEGGVEEEL